MPQPFTKTYEIGKTYKNTTRYMLGAWVGYVGAVFTLLMLALVMNQSLYAMNPIGTAVFGAVMLVAGISLHAAHNGNPERKYTVLRTFSNDDRTVAIEVRFADHATDIMHVVRR